MAVQTTLELELGLGRADLAIQEFELVPGERPQ
jgi:hypothetical protein